MIQNSISNAKSYLDLVDREDSTFNYKDIFDDKGYFKKKTMSAEVYFT